MKITIEFEKGLIREFYPNEEIVDALRNKGACLQIFTAHPNNSEMMMLNVIHDEKLKIIMGGKI